MRLHLCDNNKPTDKPTGSFNSNNLQSKDVDIKLSILAALHFIIIKYNYKYNNINIIIQIFRLEYEGWYNSKQQLQPSQ